MTIKKIISLLFFMTLLLGCFAAPSKSYANSDYSNSGVYYFEKETTVSSHGFSTDSNSSDLKELEQSSFTESTVKDDGQYEFRKAIIEYQVPLQTSCQDCCIYDNYMFLFEASGICYIYNLDNYSLISVSKLQSYNNYIPHSNSACFGNKLFETDPFPLVYCNLYGTYAPNKSTYGVCFVYRIFVEQELFEFSLVQVLKVGFSDDQDLWYDNSDNIRPYGNFLVDGDYLFVYLNIFGAEKTRFFKFLIPDVKILDGDIDYHVLDKSDIKECFDLCLFYYIQGATIHKNYLFSLEGFGYDPFPAFLRVVCLDTKEIYSLNLNELFGQCEPESIDFYHDLMIIGIDSGTLFYISLQ